MKKKPYELTTTNLTITPDDEQKLWECDWTIRMKNDPERVIGRASFAGEKYAGSIPINVELEERFTNRGYGTEVFREMVNFAFLHKNIYEVTAVTIHENDKCIMALEKSGFVYRSREGNVESYSIIKQKTSWLGVYIFIGIIAGLALGIVLGNSWVGLAIGLVVAFALGSNMDAKANKERNELFRQKEQD